MHRDVPPYLAPSYLNPKRLSSFGYQFQLAFETGGRSFLEIGPGSNFLTDLLAQIGGLVTTLDIDVTTIPSVVGTMPFLPFKNSTFDVVMAFQVLEHLPFEQFAPSIAEMTRVSSQWVLISLPDRAALNEETPREATLRQRLNPKRLLTPLIKKPSESPIDPSHAWEIGVGGIDIDSIEKAIASCGCRLERHFLNECWGWHHFFELRR